MYAAALKTDSTVVYLFVSYIVIVTLLFGNLFLGVIIDIYGEIEHVECLTLQSTLEIVFKDLSEEEDEMVFKLLYDLLEKLDVLPDPFDPLTNTTQQEDHHPDGKPVDHASELASPRSRAVATFSIGIEGDEMDSVSRFEQRNAEAQQREAQAVHAVGATVVAADEGAGAGDNEGDGHDDAQI